MVKIDFCCVNKPRGVETTRCGKRAVQFFRDDEPSLFSGMPVWGYCKKHRRHTPMGDHWVEITEEEAIVADVQEE